MARSPDSRKRNVKGNSLKKLIGIVFYEGKVKQFDFGCMPSMTISFEHDSYFHGLVCGAAGQGLKVLERTHCLGFDSINAIISLIPCKPTYYFLCVCFF